LIATGKKPLKKKKNYTKNVQSETLQNYNVRWKFTPYWHGRLSQM